MFDNLGNSLANIKAGRVKALAVATDARIAELPDVPTIAEAYPEVRASSWFGVFAEIVNSPEVRKRLEPLSLRPVGSVPAEMAAFLRDERERWATVVKRANINAE
jgi:tripartite-type tricarboxylate transporter receptor subunit TctC